MISLHIIYIATVMDTGANAEGRTLGLFTNEAKAHEALTSYVPYEFEGAAGKFEDEDMKWVRTQEFDQTHDSGAVHVTHYSLEGSRWWRGHIIKYLVKDV